MNVTDYAKYKGVHRDTVYEWLKQGKLFKDEKGEIVEPEKPEWEKERWGKFTRKCPLCAGTGMVRGEKKSFKQMHEEAMIAAANQIRAAGYYKTRRPKSQLLDWNDGEIVE